MPRYMACWFIIIYLFPLQGLVEKGLLIYGQLAVETLWHKYSTCHTEFGFKWGCRPNQGSECMVQKKEKSEAEQVW